MYIVSREVLLPLPTNPSPNITNNNHPSNMDTGNPGNMDSFRIDLCDKGVSVENEVFNVSKYISYALSGTFYGIEKSFLVVEIWISKVGWFRQLSENI